MELGPLVRRSSAGHLRDEILELVAWTARNLRDALELYPQRMPEAVLHRSQKFPLLRPGQLARGHDSHPDELQAFLYDLKLPYRRGVRPAVAGEAWPLQPASRQREHVAFASQDAPDDRQTAAALARPPGLGIVDDLVADERHGMVMQRGQDDRADLPRPARSAPFTEYLDDEIFRLDVVVPGDRTLQGDVSHLLGGVDIGKPDVPGAAHDRVRVLRQGAAEGERLAQAGQRETPFHAAPRQPVDVVGIAD